MGGEALPFQQRRGHELRGVVEVALESAAFVEADGVLRFFHALRTVWLANLACFLGDLIDM